MPILSGSTEELGYSDQNEVQSFVCEEVHEEVLFLYCRCY